ncbi:hypothetical protein Poly51_47330 [Rubripirellula tenax]|uniref:Uncharacterized protein n=1 Tax=Rubripirellula tenax TaxID=2528015 RepID=A0A5C6ENB4_9BACT|nr:hypothetical protein [Rubripirellula tenax]TWU48829.1 hypothetical protein Poly51_47330 [Rubripirellula tenax]
MPLRLTPAATAILSRFSLGIGCLGFFLGLGSQSLTNATAAADQPAPVERLGRWSGYGWSDGYHACAGSGVRLGADLPPKSYADTRGANQGGMSRGKLDGHGHMQGTTFYDRFDTARGCDAGTGCDAYGCDAGGCNHFGHDPVGDNQAPYLARADVHQIQSTMPEPASTYTRVDVPPHLDPYSMDSPLDGFSSPIRSLDQPVVSFETIQLPKDQRSPIRPTEAPKHIRPEALETASVSIELPVTFQNSSLPSSLAITSLDRKTPSDSDIAAAPHSTDQPAASQASVTPSEPSRPTRLPRVESGQQSRVATRLSDDSTNVEGVQGAVETSSVRNNPFVR